MHATATRYCVGAAGFPGLSSQLGAELGHRLVDLLLKPVELGQQQRHGLLEIDWGSRSLSRRGAPATVSRRTWQSILQRAPFAQRDVGDLVVKDHRVGASSPPTQRSRSWCRQAVRSGAVAGVVWLPRGPRVLLRAFELEKAPYEVRLEARYRPDWLPIPLGGVARLVAESSADAVRSPLPTRSRVRGPVRPAPSWNDPAGPGAGDLVELLASLGR
jgi:hypothetical protein